MYVVVVFIHILRSNCIRFSCEKEKIISQKNKYLSSSLTSDFHLGKVAVMLVLAF